MPKEKKKKERPQEWAKNYKQAMYKQMADQIRLEMEAEQEAVAKAEELAKAKKPKKSKKLKKLNIDSLDSDIDLLAMLDSKNGPASPSGGLSDSPSTPALNSSAQTPARKGKWGFLPSLGLFGKKTEEQPQISNEITKIPKGSSASPAKIKPKKRKNDGWRGKGKGFAHVVQLYMLQRPDEPWEELSKPVNKKRLIKLHKKMQKWGAKIIQKRARQGILMVNKRIRAAKVIQSNFRIYREFMATEKWMLIIRMEKKARVERERKVQEMKQKKERHKASQLLESKKKMERLAMQAGAWDPKEMKEAQKSWKKTDLARLVALNHTNGIPADEDSWEIYLEEFPKKKKSELNKMIGKMKASGSLYDLEALSELNADDLKRLVPNF